MTKMAAMTRSRWFGLVSGLGAGLAYWVASTTRTGNESSKSKTCLPQLNAKLLTEEISTSARRCHQHSKTSAVGKHASAKSTATELATQCMLKYGAPGCVVAVSVDGQLVWSEGLGLSDIENSTPCTPSTVMRIASISKSLTAVAVAKLWEQGQLDLDKVVQTYVPSFPEKNFEGQPVTITTRQLLSHLGCVRHYRKLNQKEPKEEGDVQYPEMHSTKSYKSVLDSLKLFASDELMCMPGSKFHYTTHGWTLISAVIEAASGTDYLKYMQEAIFDPLGLKSVRADRHAPLIRRRAKQYRMSNKMLQNVPFVDNSLKWAGGGLLSNAEDLVTFGSALLAMYQNTNSEETLCSDNLHTEQPTELPCALLKSSTVDKMWTPVVETPMPSHRYAWGWYVKSQGPGLPGSPSQSSLFEVMHTGGAMGGSSVLLIRPGPAAPPVGMNSDSESPGHVSGTQPCGVVVAILFNLDGVRDVHKLASSIADEFAR